VYPNPSVSTFKVDISSEEVGEVTLQVFDVLGKIVYQEKGQSDKLYNFGLNFKPGFYVVKVIQANKCVTSKIIKQ
ncbi:MAG: T9SS type A sorting domain-containing protein, partial [Sphingobacteriales bacterium]|nr:T9SS type A sorting domain-containing protein [Sphingobacteriales bacterium]